MCQDKGKEKEVGRVSLQTTMQRDIGKLQEEKGKEGG